MDEKEPNKADAVKMTLVSFAYDLGISIIIPLLLFLLIGIWFDKRFDTKPLGIIAGLLISLIPTSISIAKKVKKFNP